VSPAGEILANREIRLYREGGAVGLDGATVVPDRVSATTDEAGNISVELVPGAYLALVKTNTATIRFNVAVPDEAEALFEDLIDQSPPVDASVLVQAREAVTAAEEARDGAVGIFGGVEAVAAAVEASGQAAEAAELDRIAAQNASASATAAVSSYAVLDEESRPRTSATALLPAINIADRQLWPEVVAYDGRVTEGRWVDTNLPWSPDGRGGGAFLVAEIAIGLRTLLIEEWSYDLRPLRGAWRDTGLPWDASGIYDGAIPAQSITIDGRSIRVLELSYDLHPIAGRYEDTDEPWPAASLPDAATALPPMVVTVVDTSSIDIYIKRGRAAGQTYMQWRLRLANDPARNANVWRTNTVYECTRAADGTVTLGAQVFSGGEVETAILLPGKIDYAGGLLHGNEEMVGTPRILIDGAETAIAAGSYECSAFELYQTSDFLVPGTTTETKYIPKGDAFLRMHKRWRFTPEAGLNFRARVVPLEDATPDLGFMGMAPFTDPFGQKAIRPPYWVPENVAAEADPEIKTNDREIQIYGDTWSVYLRHYGYWSETSQIWVQPGAVGSVKGYADALRGTALTTGTELDVEFTINLLKKEAA